jgi:dissimilatory sulfite reductase (desulfoviridin) alpha/beta subunit
MALWFLRGLRRGVVTTRYPVRIDPWLATLPTPPAFRPDLLTAALAERLVVLCPSRALTTDGLALTLDIGACTACGRCLNAAGAAAAPSGEFELAATARGQLIKQIPIGGGPG